MSWREFNREFIEKNRDEAGDLAPPWAVFPGYTRVTIGWRMGSGETWLGAWYQWIEGQPTEAAWRRAYLRRHRPAPHTWADLVHRILHAGDRGQPDLDALHAEGLIGTDVAYGTWLARQDPPRAPWAERQAPWEAQPPATVVRHRCRHYAFWTRWAAAQRAAGALVLPEPPAEWQGVAGVLRSGVVPADAPSLADGYERLAVELAAGVARPPWALGLPVGALGGRLERGGGYGDAWLLWAASVFDDVPTWRDWLAMHPPPPDWAAILRERVGGLRG